MRRGELRDKQWEQLQPLLPPQQPPRGRPAKHLRTILNGILWIARTGAPWRDLPERYGPWQTVASRFYRWHRAGIWQRILGTLQQRADADGKLDREIQHLDSMVIRVHPHAAGAKGGTRRPRRWAAARVA